MQPRQLLLSITRWLAWQLRAMAARIESWSVLPRAGGHHRPAPAIDPELAALAERYPGAPEHWLREIAAHLGGYPAGTERGEMAPLAPVAAEPQLYQNPLDPAGILPRAAPRSSPQVRPQRRLVPGSRFRQWLVAPPIRARAATAIAGGGDAAPNRLAWGALFAPATRRSHADAVRFGAAAPLPDHWQDCVPVSWMAAHGHSQAQSFAPFAADRGEDRSAAAAFTAGVSGGSADVDPASLAAAQSADHQAFRGFARQGGGRWPLILQDALPGWSETTALEHWPAIPGSAQQPRAFSAIGAARPMAAIQPAVSAYLSPWPSLPISPLAVAEARPWPLDDHAMRREQQEGMWSA